MEKLFHIVCINERTGKKSPSGFAPDTHVHCCTLMLKMTKYTWRRVLLEEVKEFGESHQERGFLLGAP